MNRAGYPTDTTDAEWAVIPPYLPRPDPAKGGRPRRHSLRQVLDAIFYAVRSGRAWRRLPRDSPPWQTGYHYRRTWRLDGTRAAIHAARRERERARLGRAPQPSACIVDSQSVKTAGVGGARGYGAGKQVKGRKRHRLVDTQGLVLAAKVHAADGMDRDGIKLLLDPIRDTFVRLKRLWLDAGYIGAGKGKDWVEQELGWTADIVRHPPKPRRVRIPKGVEPDWDAILPPPHRGRYLGQAA